MTEILDIFKVTTAKVTNATAVGCNRNGPRNVVLVYNVTIVEIGDGLFKKYCPMVIGCVLRTAGSSLL